MVARHQPYLVASRLEYVVGQVRFGRRRMDSGVVVVEDQNFVVLWDPRVFLLDFDPYKAEEEDLAVHYTALSGRSGRCKIGEEDLAEHYIALSGRSDGHRLSSDGQVADELTLALAATVFALHLYKSE